MLYGVYTDIKWILSEEYLVQNLVYYALSYVYNNMV